MQPVIALRRSRQSNPGYNATLADLTLDCFAPCSQFARNDG